MRSAVQRCRSDTRASAGSGRFSIGFAVSRRAHQAAFEYIKGWYNTRRHSSLGYLSPAAYEAGTAISLLPTLKVA
jgi:transposase InsO family protein